jgi:hypothetical protein
LSATATFSIESSPTFSSDGYVAIPPDPKIRGKNNSER